MDCVAVPKASWVWYVVGPIVGLGILAVLLVWLILTYRSCLLQAWETMRINALKRRLGREYTCCLFLPPHGHRLTAVGTAS